MVDEHEMNGSVCEPMVTEADAEATRHAADTEEPETMESIMQKFGAPDIHRGKVVEGTIVDARDDGWLVDVGYKCEGFLPRREWTHRVLVEPASEPQVGDKVRVQVINVGQGEDAQLSLSRWRCEFDERWNDLEAKLTESEIISTQGIRKVKGGLIVDCCGIEGFIPISHLAEEGRGVNPSRLLDQSFPVKLIEKDRRKRRLVLSRRSMIEEEMTSVRGEFYSRVNEGDDLEGEVSSITSFGVFVNLGALEGLVHISELSWQRNAKAKDIVTKGDKVNVRVIGIDKDTNRISLSIKQTLDDPWNTACHRWLPGTKSEGIVTNLTDFGAFVEIEAGVEGLVHIGDLSWSRIKHPKEVLKKGQKIDVVVLDVDPERRRIGLGFKQLHDPWKDVTEKYTKDQDVPVKVVRLADFGAFVELDEGVEGLIHISQLSRQRVEKPGDVLSEGQEVTARILEVNPTERRIRLSLRVLQDGGDEAPAATHHRPSRDEDSAPRRKRRESEQTPKNLYPQEEASVTIGDFLKLQD